MAFGESNVQKVFTKIERFFEPTHWEAVDGSDLNCLLGIFINAYSICLSSYWSFNRSPM